MCDQLNYDFFRHHHVSRRREAYFIFVVGGLCVVVRFLFDFHSHFFLCSFLLLKINKSKKASYLKDFIINNKYFRLLLKLK